MWKNSIHQKWRINIFYWPFIVQEPFLQSQFATGLSPFKHITYIKKKLSICEVGKYWPNKVHFRKFL